MKVLITGTGGFIANNVAEYLQQNSEHEIIGTYRNNKPKSQLFSSIRCDLYFQPKILEDLKFDAVIHFVSQLYGENIREFLDNTVQTTRNMIDIAKGNGVKKFIYISSISVCGETKGRLNENSERVNQNDYEVTKWIGERLLQDAEFEEKVIIRLPRVLGRGVDYSAPWLPKVSYSIMQNETVYYYNPELKYNALIHTDDLAQFIGHILNEDNDFSGTYVLGSDNEMSILEMLNLLKGKFHSESALVEIEPKGVNRSYLVDIRKAKGIGFHADSVKNVLEKYVRNMKEINV